MKLSCLYCGKPLLVAEVLKDYDEFLMCGICKGCLKQNQNKSVIGQSRAGEIPGPELDRKFNKIISDNF